MSYTHRAITFLQISLIKLPLFIPKTFKNWYVVHKKKHYFVTKLVIFFKEM